MLFKPGREGMQACPGLPTLVFRLSLRGPQTRSNLMGVKGDCFAEFILSAAEGLAMILGRTEGPRIAIGVLKHLQAL